MSNAFEILNTNSEKYPIIVVAKNYLGLSEYISELELTLRNKNFKGNVVFDLMLSNGYKSHNRFLCSKFDGQFFYELHHYSLDSRHRLILEKLKGYYFSNEDLLSKGILSRKEILTIKTTHTVVAQREKKNKREE